MSTQLEILRLRLQAAEESALRWRTEAGRLACLSGDKTGVSGFCNHSRTLSGDAGCMPSKLAARLGRLFANRSVLDLGAGLGLYGRYFASHSPGVRYTAVDGAEGIEEVTHGHVHFAELTDPLPTRIRDLGEPWDYVMSLEVAEHVPRALEPRLLHNLATAATLGVVLSWARLGQGGTAHVNCQPQAYVACAMGHLGWQRDEVTEQWLRSAVGRHFHDCGWLRTSLLAFSRTSAPSSMLLPLPPVPTRAFMDSYLQLTSAKCPYVSDGCDTTKYKYDINRVVDPVASSRKGGDSVEGGNSV